MSIRDRLPSPLRQHIAAAAGSTCRVVLDIQDATGVDGVSAKTSLRCESGACRVAARDLEERPCKLDLDALCSSLADVLSAAAARYDSSWAHLNFLDGPEDGSCSIDAWKTLSCMPKHNRSLKIALKKKGAADQSRVLSFRFGSSTAVITTARSQQDLASGARILDVVSGELHAFQHPGQSKWHYMGIYSDPERWPKEGARRFFEGSDRVGTFYANDHDAPCRVRVSASNVNIAMGIRPRRVL